MTNPTLSNYVGNPTVILWQYDKALNLVALINKWNEFAKASCEDFWNYFGNKVLPIEQADTYGLNVWGNLLGIPRPKITVDGESTKISDDLYRRLLKARFFFYMEPPTTKNYNIYLAILFGATKGGVTYYSPVMFDEDGKPREGYKTRNHVLDFLNMSMGFSFPEDATQEEAYLILQHYDTVYPFPAGIRYPGEFIVDDLVIGMNETQDGGTQDYRNFVDGLVLAEENSTGNPNGGIFSGTDRANYTKTFGYGAHAAVLNVQAETKTIGLVYSGNGTRGFAWVDWGDGNASYEYVPKTEKTLSHTYAFSETTRIAVVVYCGSGVDVTMPEGEGVVEYEWMGGV